MNEELSSQFVRARELQQDLIKSITNDLSDELVSTKTRNLTQELLVKIRSILDQVMYSFFENEILPCLDESEKKKAKVYFPIVSKKGDLKSVLGRFKVKDLDQTHPNIFNFLESIQPYNKNYEWLTYLVQYSNEKHIRLTPQKRIEHKRLSMGSNGAGITLTGGASISLGRGASISIGGRRIYGNQVITPDSNHIFSDPNLDIKKEKWVAFVFENSNINVLKFCEISINKTEKIINDFLNMF
jgi:hypothetical protein